MAYLFYPIEYLDSVDVNMHETRKIKGFFIIINEKGLHTRPATELVKCANNFQAIIRLVYQKTSINAKSVLDILTLSAARGSTIYIEAEGADAENAVKAIIDLASNKFNINY